MSTEMDLTEFPGGAVRSSDAAGVRFDPIPDTAERAVDIAGDGGVCWTESITVRSVAGDPYERIVDRELGEKPEPVRCDVVTHYDEQEIPF